MVELLKRRHLCLTHHGAAEQPEWNGRQARLVGQLDMRLRQAHKAAGFVKSKAAQRGLIHHRLNFKDGRSRQQFQNRMAQPLPPAFRIDSQMLHIHQGIPLPITQ